MRTVILSSSTAALVEESDCLNLFWTVQAHGDAVYGLDGVYFDKHGDAHNLEELGDAYIEQFNGRSMHDINPDSKRHNIYGYTYFVWVLHNPEMRPEFPESELFFKSSVPTYVDKVTPFELFYNYTHLTLKEAISEVMKTNRYGTLRKYYNAFLAPLWRSCEPKETKRDSEGTSSALPKNLALAKVQEWLSWEEVKSLVSYSDRVEQITKLANSLAL